MAIKLETYDIKNWTVLGRTVFKPPFNVSDALINEARIVYVVNGQSELYSSNQLIHLEKGDLLIMKTDNFVNHWQKNESDEMNTVIVFQINSDLLNHLYNDNLPEWFTQNSDSSNSIVKTERHVVIDSFFENLQVYLNHPKLLTEEVIQIKIKEIISLIIQSDQSGNAKRIFGHLFKPNDYNFQETIQKNLYKNLTIDELAFLAGMSLSSFKRKFSTVYSDTPNKYITSKRLEKAKNLLTTSDLNISEIAYDCGFSDISYFSKTFKKHYNTSPSEIKKA